MGTSLYKCDLVTNLIELERSPRRPAHLFVYDVTQIPYFGCSLYIGLPNAIQRLFRNIKILDENHDRIRGDLYTGNSKKQDEIIKNIKMQVPLWGQE